MSVIRRLSAYAKENQIVVDDVEIESPDPTRTSKVAAVITLRLPTKCVHTELIEKISDIEGIIYVEEI